MLLSCRRMAWLALVMAGMMVMTSALELADDEQERITQAQVNYLQSMGLNVPAGGVHVMQGDAGHSTQQDAAPDCFSRVAKIRKLVKAALEAGEEAVWPEGNALSLAQCYLARVPVEISELSNIESLDLMGNQLTTLPPEFSKLPLKNLRLMGNQLTEVPRAIRGLSSLEYLNLAENEISVLPSWLGELDLTVLNAWANPIRSIPKALFLGGNGKEKKLEVLNLANCSISSIPEAVCNARKMMEFDLSNNRLTKLVDCPQTKPFGQYLIWMPLTGNKLASIPSSFCRFIGLRGLLLGGNKLTALPLCMSSLVDATTIDVSNNRLTAIPSFLRKLSKGKTEKLFLYGNTGIETIPKWVGSLKGLKELDLSETQVEVLPPSLGRLSNLERLVLVSTNVKRLPKSFGGLASKSLTFLDLWGSPLDDDALHDFCDPDHPMSALLEEACDAIAADLPHDEL